MTRERVTRRWLLRQAVPAAAATTVASGCLDRSSGAEPVDDAGLTPAELSDPEHAATVTHWFGEATSAIEAAIGDGLSSSVDLEITVYASRRGHEVAVAEGLVEGSPPDTFQTVLGHELGRYVDAVTVHRIPDLLTDERANSLRDGLVDLVAVDGDPYAVPVTIDRTNGLFVRPDELAPVDVSDLVHSDALLEALEDASVGLALPRDGRVVFRLFCQFVLAQGGVRAYDALAAGDVPAADLRGATDGIARLLGAARTAPNIGSAARAFRDGEVAMLPADSRVATHLFGGNPFDHDVVAFPGTGDAFLVHATGWTFPKRTSSPQGTAAVLTRLLDPGCQSAVAIATGTIPARADANVPNDAPAYARRLADGLEDAEHTRPAISTGCGIDTDVRRRAIEELDPIGFSERDPVDVGDALLEILR